MPGDGRVGADTGDDVGRWSTAGRVLPLRRRLPAPLPALAADLYRLSVAQYCQLSRPGNNNNRLTSTTLHTHIYPYNRPLSGTTQVSWYQKGETNLDFTEEEIVSGSGISWAICKSARRSRQTATPAPNHSLFYRPDALPAAQPTASKH